MCGTLDYLCPEVLKKKSYNQKLDIWCLGVLLYELCFGVPPFYAKEPQNKIRNIKAMKVRFPDRTTASDDLKNLIMMILQEEPENRPDIGKILEHPWMKKFYPLYNIDLENMEFTQSNSSGNGSLKDIHTDESNNPLVLRNSSITNDYLIKNGLEDLIETTINSKYCNRHKKNHNLGKTPQKFEKAPTIIISPQRSKTYLGSPKHTSTKPIFTFQNGIFVFLIFLFKKK